MEEPLLFSKEQVGVVQEYAQNQGVAIKKLPNVFDDVMGAKRLLRELRLLRHLRRGEISLAAAAAVEERAPRARVSERRRASFVKFTVLLWRPRRVPVGHEVLVERVQRFHVGRAQGRVAELRVLLDACGRHGLGNHNATSLQTPANHHLRRRQATPSRDVEQARIAELLGPRERRVGLHENALRRTELAKRRACDEGVALYL